MKESVKFLQKDKRLKPRIKKKEEARKENSKKFSKVILGSRDFKR